MFEGTKDRLRKSVKRRSLRMIAIMLLAATALTVSARTWLSLRETRAKSMSAPPAHMALQTDSQEQGVIRLLTTGFNPTEVTGSSGQYRLAVTRSSRDEDVVLELKSAGGELVQEIRMPQERTDWTTLIQIPTGSYTLTVTNHPNWVCHITVQ